MTKMTPRENKWLEDYRRREAANTGRIQRRALWFWGALFTTWAIFGLFAEPDKFTFTDSLLLIMILVNVFNSIKELIRNKRIAAEKNAAETLAWRFSGHFSGGTCRLHGTGDLGRSFFSVS